MSSVLRIIHVGCLILLVSGLSACIVPKIHKVDTVDPGKNGVTALSIDAKQRIVLFSKPADSDGYAISCAEPSPDALSALSSGVGFGAQYAKVLANLAVSQSESAASIGLRTQSIQLLRDGMYRLCEAFAARAIDGAEFNRQQRRYQNLMLSLLAIEQLTGAVVPRQVGLGEGSAFASVGDKADEAAGALGQATVDVATAQTALKEAQDKQKEDADTCEKDSASPACDNASTNETSLGQKQAALKEAKEKETTAKQVLSAARAAVRSSASGAKVSFADASPKSLLTDNSARYIAEATRTIVATTLLASFAQEECSKVWEFVKYLDANDKAKFLSSVDTKAPTKSGEQIQAETVQSQFVHLAKNCQANTSMLFANPTLFEPQYASDPGTLQVLGADAGIKLGAADKTASLFIVGGVRPYQVSSAGSDLIKASLRLSNGTFALQVKRATGASAAAKGRAFVVDASGSHVEVVVSMVAAGAAANAKSDDNEDDAVVASASDAEN